MADSLNPIINTVSRFCGEHAHILIISGIAVIVLVIIAAVAAGRRRREQARPCCRREGRTEAGLGPAELWNSRDHAPGRHRMSSLSHMKSLQAKAPSITDGHGISRTCMHRNGADPYISRENREPPGRDIRMTGGNLEEIEIKIQGAEVRIRYSGKRPSQKMTGSCNPCCPDGEREAQEVIGEKIMPDDISGKFPKDAVIHMTVDRTDAAGRRCRLK